MESPPSCSTWSEAFLLSDDSGLLMTSGSISSGSMSGESRSGRKFTTELLESDGEDKSLSQADSLDGMSDGGMCGENFNTLKKGPNWCDLSDPKQLISIDPPPEFQDSPLLPPRNFNVQYPLQKWLDKFSSRLTATILDDALCACCKMTWSIPCSRDCHAVVSSIVRPRTERTLKPRLCWTPELLPVSPCHIVSNRPNSRSSLSSSRLSSSHNSLSIPAALKVDDSSFITQAVSHDALAAGQICDIYNVPFDSDIYAVPVDTVRPPRTPPRRNKQQRCQRKRRRNVSAGSQSELARHIAQARQLTSKPRAVSHVIKSQAFLSDVCNTTTGKRHSVPGSSLPQPEAEPIHMTLQEVRQYLQTLYSSSSDSSDNKNKPDPPRHETIKVIGGSNTDVISNYETKVSRNSHRKHKKSSFVINIKNKKVKDSSESNKDCYASETVKTAEKRRKSPVRTFSLNLKQTLCNLFRFRKVSSPGHVTTKREVVVKVKEVLEEEDESYVDNDGQKVPVQKRALPPLPADENPCKSEYNSDQADGKKMVEEDVGGELSMDFASSIEKVKDYGWYWGPISGEAAEKILSNEPDGSFIVRDSSDDHYIFSLTFKLNGCVRHVRIEHDQGNFSFGSCTKFKSHTIVEFIENAVEHSRSGRYLFFLHRRPVLGPMRVQLLHPVSRFKQVQSLQHMCRFVILKLVRRDLISQLPLPRRVIDYLSTPHYYSEQFLESEESSDSGAAPVTESNENGSDRNSASPRPHS